MRKEMLVAVEQLNAAGDMAHREVVPQFMEKLGRYAGILLVEPGCSHSAENDSTLLSKSSDSDDLVCKSQLRTHLMGAAGRKLPFACNHTQERLHRETDPRTTLTGKMDTRSPLDGNRTALLGQGRSALARNHTD
jgi:hypothetical protein